MEIVDESKFQKNLLDLMYKSPNSHTMLQEIAQRCGELLRVDSCLILAGVEPLETAQIGFWQRNQLDFSLTESFFSHSEINTVLETDQPCILSNDLAEILSVTTLLGIRTKFQGTVNGLIILGKINSQFWTTNELNQLLEASNYVSIASTIVRLQKENRSVKENNISRDSIPKIPLMKRLYDLTRQQLEQQRYLLEQQRQLNEKKNEIIAAISDKARNPLATMKLAIDLLSNPQRNLPPQLQYNYWNILRQEWNNLNELINSIVTLEQLESKEITYQPQLINLKAISEKLNSTFKKQWSQDQRKSLSLEIDLSNSPSQIQTDLQHLESILHELLTNAAHFSLADQTIFVKFSQITLDEPEVVQITMTNTGLGISVDEKELIYEPFYRGKGVIEKGIPGTGVGLAVVKGLVELLGGRIEMTSNAINNSEHYLTSFIIELPLKPDTNLYSQRC